MIDSGNISEKDKETLQELDVTELSIAAISAKLCDIVRNEMHLTDIALHNIVKTNSSLINKISSIQTKIAELYRLKSKQYDIHSSVIGLYINAVWARSISVLLTENNENSWELQKILSLHKNQLLLITLIHFLLFYFI